jgi:hypothetical protein
MRVEFEFTQEDSIDVAKRVLARSKVIRSWQWKGLIYTAIIGWMAWVLVFVALFSASPLTAALTGVIVAGLTALFYPGSHRRAIEKRLRNLHQEKYGETKSFICEVELTPTGVSVRQMNRQTTYEWKIVEEIVVSEDSVDIFTRDDSGVVVRKRAFNSLEEQWQFVSLAKQYLEQSRQGHSAE